MSAEKQAKAATVKETDRDGCVAAVGRQEDASRGDVGRSSSIRSAAHRPPPRQGGGDRGKMAGVEDDLAQFSNR
jgi:hypothetical protein